MSDEQEPNNPTSLRARRNPGQSVIDRRSQKQAAFLAAYREIGVIKSACLVAKIDRSTYYDWRDNDPDFAAQLPETREEANETLENAAYDRAVNGVPSYVVSQGKLVYGPDKKPLIERKYSDTLLITLLKAHMPQKYKDQSKIEHSGPGGGPLQSRVEIYRIKIPDNGRDASKEEAPPDGN